MTLDAGLVAIVKSRPARGLLPGACSQEFVTKAAEESRPDIISHVSSRDESGVARVNQGCKMTFAPHANRNSRFLLLRSLSSTG